MSDSILGLYDCSLLNNSQLSATFDITSRAVTPIADTPQSALHGRSASETIQLFNDAVQYARTSLPGSVNPENANIESKVPLSLTIDLNRKNLEVLPREIVGIIKENVER